MLSDSLPGENEAKAVMGSQSMGETTPSLTRDGLVMHTSYSLFKSKSQVER